MADFYNDTSNTIISGTSDADSIWNYGESVTINAGDGDNTVRNSDSYNSVSGNSVMTGDSVMINAGVGNDSINNEGENATINAGAGNDFIDNGGWYITINAGDGDDSIDNNGRYITINAGDGDDSIDNNGRYITINAGDGDDSIDNSGWIVTINAGDGNDSIYNPGWDITINAGDGNDSIFNEGWGVTINADVGDDVINLISGSARIEYNDGDGDDTVYGFSNEWAMLAFADGLSTTSIRSGDDVIISVEGDSIGTITLKDVDIYIPTVENVNANVNLSNYDDYSNGYFIVDGSSVEDTDTFYTASFTTSTVGTDIVVGSVTADHAYVATDGARQYININDDGWSVTASDGDDTVNNWGGDSIFIDAGAGVDSIESGTDHSTLLGGAGRDSIRNHGMLTLIDGGADNDTIACYIKGDDTDGSSSSYTTLLGGDGNDYIDNHGHHASIEGGDGDDTLYNYVGDDYGAHLEYEAHYSTIRGGNGNDYIDNHGHHALVEGGDGDDTLYNYNGAYFEDEAHYSTLLGGSGNDVIDNHGSNVMINAGTGDDEILLNSDSARLEYNDGDGDDTIYGFSNETATLAFADGLSTSSMQSGNDVIITVEGASIGTVTLKDVSAESNDFTVALAKSSYTIPAVDALTGSRDENYVLLLGAAPAHTMQSPDGGEFSIWLNGWDGISHDADINIVDASKFNGNSTIVGNALENVLVGSNGDNSLWGGEGSENDTLCGGDGFNEFFYLKGNGNDVINNAGGGDLINLLNINLDDIDADSLLEGIDAGSITLKFNDGGSIRVNSSSDVNFRLADGSTWQAVERDSYTRHWDIK